MNILLYYYFHFEQLPLTFIIEINIYNEKKYINIKTIKNYTYFIFFLNVSSFLTLNLDLSKVETISLTNFNLQY